MLPNRRTLWKTVSPPSSNHRNCRHQCDERAAVAVLEQVVDHWIREPRQTHQRHHGPVKREEAEADEHQRPRIAKTTLQHQCWAHSEWADGEDDCSTSVWRIDVLRQETIWITKQRDSFTDEFTTRKNCLVHCTDIRKSSRKHLRNKERRSPSPVHKQFNKVKIKAKAIDFKIEWITN